MLKQQTSSAKRSSHKGGPALQADMRLDSLEQARLLFQPLRIEILQLLASAQSCGELAAQLGCSTQKVNYHVKALEAAGLVRRVAQRRVRALTEGIYQARARSFWPGASLLQGLGAGPGGQDALSKNYLLALAGEFGSDAARLALGSAAAAQEHPTLSLSAQVSLADPRRRSAFLSELKLALLRLAEKYGADGETDTTEEYKLVLACYPAQPDAGEAEVSEARSK
jgi:biotin operon repressor